MKLFRNLLILTLPLLIFSACISKSSAPAKPSPTPKPQTIELKPEEKPYISLIPSADGHWLKLKIDNIPNFITQIEYELIYRAVDNQSEIEKGVGDTVKDILGNRIERDLLMGTSSCTNGCKYKYDAGITGGSLSLTFIRPNNEPLSFETSFTLKTGTDLKKEKVFSLVQDNFSINLSSPGSDYFVLLKNYGYPKNPTVSAIYSVFSSASGLGKIISIKPDGFTKENPGLLIGDYLLSP